MRKGKAAITAIAIAAVIALPIRTGLASSEDTYISDEIQEVCEEIGDGWGICPELLEAIIEAESSGRQYAQNGSCKGLMQVNTANADVIEYMSDQGYTDVYDIEANIDIGCWVLMQKAELYDGDLYGALMAYNGTSNVSARLESGDYTYYCTSVAERAEELERIHGK